ncbi:hypothetical protein H2248_005637 [Termitomyces sp. 'cryptogamus']|nr:hypothetical protein H2248_005637 [Termitomyces sp. 'cryptogamus']
MKQGMMCMFSGWILLWPGIELARIIRQVHQIPYKLLKIDSRTAHQYRPKWPNNIPRSLAPPTPRETRATRRAIPSMTHRPQYHRTQLNTLIVLFHRAPI